MQQENKIKLNTARCFMIYIKYMWFIYKIMYT